VVAAPSKLRRPSGDRVKTDARDAIHLARLLRLDEVTPVVVPSVEQESARDLFRAHEDARGDLLRQGIVYNGGHAWTTKHEAWLRRQHFDPVATQLTYESDYDAAITVMAADSGFTPLVHRLGALKGISTLTGFALAVEIGDWHQFTGNTIGLFVGLVPSESSSGASRVQGPITKTGNTHVRRLLVEAAWHHRTRYRPGESMRDRWELTTPATRPRGDAGNWRLNARWDSFTARRKKPVIANVAIARELAGRCWSLAILYE
jgi:transposase